MKATAPQSLRVLIPLEVKHRLDLYIQCSPLEISGLGEAVLIEDNVFYIKNVFILPQTVSAASTYLAVPAVGQFLTQLIQEGRDPELIKVWWHSHADMGCFWSSIDDSTIEKFKNEWMIAIVGNHHGEYKVRVDLYSPVRVVIDDLQLEVVVDDPDEEMRAEVEAEIAAKVIQAPLPPAVGFNWRKSKWTEGTWL